jgi:thioredoxin-like negative regulator of GroEL
MSVPTTTSGRAAAAAALGQEAGMGKAIPSQHPAVVLRSQYKLVRALLAVAMIAVVGLTAAVVILANDTDEVGQSASSEATRSLTPKERATYGPSSVAPSTRYDAGPEEATADVTAAELPKPSPGTRYDGGPEEGTRAIGARHYSKNAATGDTTPPTGSSSDGAPDNGASK